MKGRFVDGIFSRKEKLDAFFPWRWSGEKIAVYLIVLSTLTVFSYGGAFFEIISYLHAEKKLGMGRIILEGIDRVQQDIEEIRLGQAGYLVSGQTAYLVSYTTGIDKLILDMAPLGQLLDDGGSGDVLARLNDYEKKAGAIQSRLSQMLKQRGLMETRQHFESIQSRSLLREIPDFMNGIRNDYVRIVRETEKSVRDHLVWTTTLFTLSIIFFSSFLGITSARILEDISKVNSLITSLHHDAHHDPLTGLPNRAFVTEWLETFLSGPHKPNGRLAIVYIDLDRFKEINDRLGHEMGDMALRAVSHRFRSVLKRQDILARLGGDEFILLMSGYSDPKSPVRVAFRLLKTLEDTFALGNDRASLGASIGIAVYPEDGKTPDSLMKKADEAMYRSKSEGRNRISLASYDPDTI